MDELLEGILLGADIDYYDKTGTELSNLEIMENISRAWNRIPQKAREQLSDLFLD